MSYATYPDKGPFSNYIALLKKSSQSRNGPSRIPALVATHNPLPLALSPAKNVTMRCGDALPSLMPSPPAKSVRRPRRNLTSDHYGNSVYVKALQRIEEARRVKQPLSSTPHALPRDFWHAKNRPPSFLVNIVHLPTKALLRQRAARNPAPPSRKGHSQCRATVPDTASAGINVFEQPEEPKARACAKSGKVTAMTLLYSSLGRLGAEEESDSEATPGIPLGPKFTWTAEEQRETIQEPIRNIMNHARNSCDRGNRGRRNNRLHETENDSGSRTRWTRTIYEKRPDLIAAKTCRAKPRERIRLLIGAKMRSAAGNDG